LTLNPKPWTPKGCGGNKA